MQNRTKFIQKSPQNPLKADPKSFQNLPKTLPKPSQSDHGTPNTLQMRSKSEKSSIFSIFSNFLEGPGPPKMEPKSLKSAKKRIKIDVQKKHVFQHRFFSIFRGFGLRKPLQNRCFFASFSKTSILCKSLQNTGCAHKNQGSDIKKRKNHKKIDSKTHSKKASQKNFPKIDFGLHFGLPKPFQNRPNIEKIRKKKKIDLGRTLHPTLHPPRLVPKTPVAPTSDHDGPLWGRFASKNTLLHTPTTSRHHFDTF